MDSLKLDAESLNEMKSFYQEELNKTLKRLEHINKIMKQLGETGAQIEIRISDDVLSYSPRTRQASAVTKRKYKKKRGPKSKWDKVIVKSIRQAGKPLTYDQLTDYLMISEGKEPSKRKNIKATVQNTIFRLRKENKVMTYSTGSRVKYIAPSDWYDRDGVIKTEYGLKVTQIKKSPKPGPKAKKRGPGRPPKKVNLAKAETSKKSIPAAKKKVSSDKNKKSRIVAKKKGNPVKKTASTTNAKRKAAPVKKAASTPKKKVAPVKKTASTTIAKRKAAPVKKAASAPKKKAAPVKKTASTTNAKMKAAPIKKAAIATTAKKKAAPAKKVTPKKSNTAKKATVKKTVAKKTAPNKVSRGKAKVATVPAAKRKVALKKTVRAKK